ncbi:hypothetical protein BCR42DRAFT_408679 [Absidia repens]|uniref:GATA-type domain-containing protein n=1 Tax=Absidia repens TaxID=90262 RepID=A0A1X2IRP0_9FUNG|nr:hypothetical protein BCR42DRAFT_408679 [Absidia repens]
MAATSSSYHTNTIYYPKSNYLTSTKIMEPASSTSLSRTPAYSVFSPPELVHDDEEEDEEDPTPLPASPPTTPPSCLIMNQHRILKNSISAPPITKRRKCIPHRSPSLTPSNGWIFMLPSPTASTTSTSQSMRFIPQQEQQYQNYSYQPKIVYLRHRNTSDPLPPACIKAPSVPLPSSPSSTSSSSLLPTQSALTSMVTSHSNQYATPSQSTTQPLPLSSMVSIPSQQPMARVHADVGPQNHNAAISTAFSSGRPIRLKGPCQACHENSEACMRKAFNWPFPSDEVYYDKGRPFVYLCNKCGLRYNKSGGSVCRQCRWVLCKEEKRKVIQLIDAMRSSRSDGQVSLDEDIPSFVCTPKYWNCGRPWKIRWAVNDLVDIDDKQ